MKPIVSTRTLELIRTGALQPITIVKITTFTDRLARTGPVSHYFSDRAFAYDYADTGTRINVESHLLDCSDVAQAIQHLSSSNSGIVNVKNQITLEFSNGVRVVDGLRLFRSLLTENIVGADVLIAEVLLDPSKDWVNEINTLDGDEHVVLFRGSCLMPRDADSRTFSLDVVQPKFAMTQVVLDSPTTNAPRDNGKRANQVYGKVNLVECHGVDVPRSSILRTEIHFTHANGDLLLTSVVGFPFDGKVQVGSEIITYFESKTNDQSLNIDRRAQDQSVAQWHEPGALVILVDRPYVFAVAAHEVNAIVSVYALSFDGSLFRLDPSWYTANTADTGTELGDGTLTWASIRINTAQLETMIHAMNAQPLLLEPGSTPNPPDFNTYQTTTTFTVEEGTPGPDKADFLPGDSQDVTRQNSGVNHSVTYGFGINTRRVIIAYWLTGDEPWTSDDIVTGWTVRINVKTFVCGGPDVRKLRAQLVGYAANCGYGGQLATLEGTNETINNGVITLGPFSPTSDTCTIDDFLCTNQVTWAGFRVMVWLDDDHTTSTATGTKPTIIDNAIEIDFTTQTSSSSPDVNALEGVSPSRFPGDQLRLFVDVEGYKVPTADTSYTVAAGELILTPPDVVRHLIQERSQLGYAAIDETSWASAEAEFPGVAVFNRVLSETAICDEGFDAPAEYGRLLGDNSQYTDVGSQIEIDDNIAVDSRGVVFYNVTPVPDEFLDRQVLSFIANLDVDSLEITNNPVQTTPVILDVEVFAGLDNTNQLLKLFATGSVIQPSGNGSYGPFTVSTAVADPVTAAESWGFLEQWIGSPVTLRDLMTVDPTSTPSPWAGGIVANLRMTVPSTADGDRKLRFADDEACNVDFTLRGTEASFVESDLGHDFESVAGRVAWDRRSQIVRVDGIDDSTDGPLFRWLTPSNDGSNNYTYPTPTVTIRTWERAVENARSWDDIYTRLRVFFFPDRASPFRAGSTGEAKFVQSAVANNEKSTIPGVTTADIDTAEAKVGAREHPGLVFPTVVQRVNAEDSASFYIQETLATDRPTIDFFGVPWTEAYLLEIGDTFFAQLEDWTAEKKLRTIGVSRPQRGSRKIDLVAVEVA